jgi:hypothetical protein
MSILKDLHLEELHKNGLAQLIDDNTVMIPITHLSPSPESFSVEKRIRITCHPNGMLYDFEVYYHAYSDKESIECPILKQTLLPKFLLLECLRDNPTHY